MTDRPTVREEITDIKTQVATLANDVAWIKRGMFGLYALIGSIIAGFLVSLASGSSVTQAAQVLTHLFS